MSEYLANKDALSNIPGRLAYDGSTAVAMTIPLTGDSFHGAVIDETARWFVVEVANGAITQAAGELTLTAPASGDAAAFSSIKSYPLVGGADLVLRGTIRFPTAPEAGNVRTFGLWADEDNYAVFVLDGASWLCRVYCDGAPQANDVAISTPAASSGANMEVEIRLSKTNALFFANGGGGKTLVGSFTSIGKTGPLMTLARVYAYVGNVSAAPAAASNTIVVNEIGLVRSFENWPTTTRVARIDANSLVARGPVFYCGMSPLKPLAGGVLVYDGTSASGGTRIAEFDAYMAGYPVLPGPIECADGLYVEVADQAYPAYIYYVVA